MCIIIIITVNSVFFNNETRVCITLANNIVHSVNQGAFDKNNKPKLELIKFRNSYSCLRSMSDFVYYTCTGMKSEQYADTEHVLA